MGTTADQAMVAASLEAEPALLPYLPELLADLEALGSDPAVIVRLLAGLPLPPSARVIDAGCGKGAVSLAIASTLGFRVLGIDLFEPFVGHCRQAAARAGLSGLCEFRHGNIAALAPPPPPGDALVFAALGDILGPPPEAIAILRRLVRPGGYIVVSDPYLREDADAASAPPQGFENYRSRSETAAGWCACGDSLLRVADVEEDDDDDGQEEVALIRGRAQALAARHPSLAAALLRFAESQSAATAYIEDNLVDALWLIQRS